MPARTPPPARTASTASNRSFRISRSYRGLNSLFPRRENSPPVRRLPVIFRGHLLRIAADLTPGKSRFLGFLPPPIRGPLHAASWPVRLSQASRHVLFWPQESKVYESLH